MQNASFLLYYSDERFSAGDERFSAGDERVESERSNFRPTQLHMQLTAILKQSLSQNGYSQALTFKNVGSRTHLRVRYTHKLFTQQLSLLD